LVVVRGYFLGCCSCSRTYCTIWRRRRAWI